MSNEFNCSKHIYIIKRFFWGLCFLSILFIVYITRIYIISGFQYEFIYVIVCFFLILFVIVYLRSLTKISVLIDKMGITYKNGKHEIFIPFKEIARVTFVPSIFLSTERLVIKNEQTNSIKISALLTNMEYFIFLLKQQLDVNGFSSIYDEREIFYFYEMCTSMTCRWKRLYSFFPMIIFINVVLIALTIGLMYFDNAIFLAYIISSIIAFVFYLVRETNEYASQNMMYCNKRTWEITYPTNKQIRKFRRSVFILQYFIYVLITVIIFLI